MAETGFNVLERIGLQVLEQALGYGLGGAATPAIAPFTQSLSNKFWALHPVLPLTPADAATAVVQGALSHGDALVYALQSGVGEDVFNVLVKVNGSPIAPDQALDLWNRGEIQEGDVERALLQSRLKPEWVDTFKLLRVQLLQLADLAEMVVQNILSESEAAARAEKLGYSADDFAKLVRLAGNPPGPETALEMWNRNVATEEEATLMLRQSRLKPEWIEQFKQTRFRPASVSQAVEAVIKQRISPAEGLKIAAENGVAEDAFKLAVEAGGRPIATGEALTLLNRGEMTEQEVLDAIYRSDVRSEYAPFIVKLRTHYPSLYQVKQILATGAITDQQATEILHKEGYTDDVIKGIVAAAHGIKLQKTKDLSQAAILDSYKIKETDKANATQMLKGLGFDQADVDLLLGYADYEVAKTYRAAALAVVKARYLASDIDEATASQWLTDAGIPTDARDSYLHLWTLDLQANPKLLTLAELNALVKKQLYTPDQYRAYLPRLGYVEPEISLLVSLYASG